MKRRLLNLLAAVALILFAATTAIWLRSLWWSDVQTCHVGNGPSYFQWESYKGRLRISKYVVGVYMPPQKLKAFIALRSTGLAALAGRFLKIAIGRAYMSNGVTVFYGSFVFFPAILPVIFFGLLSALSLLSRPKLRLAGHCPSCGYDLRATPTRCPECGTTPKTA
jgi:hypothetical protein